MSEKRRDKRNRILHNGESQLADGRYRFRYTDLDGVRRDVYSWRLNHNDRMPVDKPKDLSLREKEKQIERDLFNQVVANGGNLTVLELCEKYTSLKCGVRSTTRTGYKTVLNLLKKDTFGNKRIDKVKLSDAKAFLIKLQKTDGKSYSSIHQVRGVLRPAFEMAYQDDLIRKNPFQFELASVVVNDSVTREAITRKQQKDYLKFVKEDTHFSAYYEVIYILFNTGLRISEFCGLTISDSEFDKKRIKIDHQLQYINGEGMAIQQPKTESGVRFVPMTDEVEACFKTLIKQRIKPKVEVMLDGYSGFLCLDDKGKPMLAYHWEKRMQRILEKYNSIYKIQMPKVTPHVCRHTFCSNMAKSGMNPKTLQYIMGHSDISVTLNTYTHLTFEDAQEELARIVNQ